MEFKEEQFGCLLTSGLLNRPGPLRDEVVKAYNSARKEAFEEQGDRAFEQPKHDAAIHEAGHVVISAAKGWPVRWVEIKHHDLGGWHGWTEGEGPTFDLG